MLHWDVPLEPLAFILALIGAFCIGMSKAGFSGISLVAVAIFADLFGASPSVGLVLPLLIVADLTVYPAFRKHGSWAGVWKLLPPTLVGLGIGYFALDRIPEESARTVIGGIILLMVLLQVWRKVRPEGFQKLADSKEFGIAAGGFGGIATMMANAAGPVIQLYLLSREIPKMELLGIAARFFLLVNLLKVPLGAGLNIVNAESLWVDLWLTPAVVIGVFVGKALVHRVPQQVFEGLIIGFAVLASFRLLFW